MDTLSKLLDDLDFSAEVFFSGGLCGLQSFRKEESSGHLHLLSYGRMTLFTDQGHKQVVTGPAVLFIPSGSLHRIQVDDSDEAQLVCATVELQGQQKSRLASQLPKFVCLDMTDDPKVLNTAQSIFEEAFSEREGRHLLTNRLCDVFLVQLLRFVVEQGTVELGLLSASSHSELAPLMVQLQNNPERDWTVDIMASEVFMSRSKFAALFKDTVGQSPMDYLTDLRLAMAQGLLRKQRPVNLVANEVGYDDASSLTRVFKRRFGVTPKQWLKRYFKEEA